MQRYLHSCGRPLSRVCLHKKMNAKHKPTAAFPAWVGKLQPVMKQLVQFSHFLIAWPSRLDCHQGNANTSVEEPLQNASKNAGVF